jgi:hypothetical protein
VFENRVLRRIFVTEREEIMQYWKNASSFVFMK